MRGCEIDFDWVVRENRLQVDSLRPLMQRSAFGMEVGVMALQVIQRLRGS